MMSIPHAQAVARAAGAGSNRVCDGRNRSDAGRRHRSRPHNRTGRSAGADATASRHRERMPPVVVFRRSAQLSGANPREAAAMKKPVLAISDSPAFRFVLTMGAVNLFADTTYEGGA